MPSTALVRPTANSKSGRKRVRAYHSRSLSRLKLPSKKFRPAAVIWSKVPVIVTFGAGGPAGACANTGGASIARMTKASTAVRTLLLITASSSGGEKHRIPSQHSTPTSPTTPERASASRAITHEQARRRRSLGGPLREELLESVGDGTEHRDSSPNPSRQQRESSEQRLKDS